MTLSPYRSLDAPGDDGPATLAAAFTTPSGHDERLARAWARAGELGVALRELTDEIAVVRRRNRILEAELETMRSEQRAQP